MKKQIRMMAAMMAALAMPAAAQQIDNSDFEGEWVNCIPYTYYGSEGYTDQLSQVVVGVNPANWIISNVTGMASYYEGEAMGLGSTQVGFQAEGYEGGTAVQLVNSPNPFMEAQIVPAYISLGTTWSTANPAFGMTGFTINNSDGGSFGGQAFTARPKGIEFMYKRARGAAKPEEKSTVVAYLWKGHWTQNDVPVTIYMAGEPTKVAMTDRDRCVLGYSLEGCQGGEVTHTDDAELIAVINAEITADSEEWVKFSADFEYMSDATPEMINIVIAAGDYFGGADVVGRDNSLTIDNFKLIYDDVQTGENYIGTLNIEMLGGMIAENMPATINIAMTADDECTLTLPNFMLDLGGGPTPLGDIVVPGVKLTPGENNVTNYNGSVTGMQLLGGELVADVNVSGTIDAEGNADFNIAVIWNEIPINVTFTGKRESSGISGIAADNAQVEYYNLNGVRVNGDNMAPGLYVKRQGNKVSKVIIR